MTILRRVVLGGVCKPAFLGLGWLLLLGSAGRFKQGESGVGAGSEGGSPLWNCRSCWDIHSARGCVNTCFRPAFVNVNVALITICFCYLINVQLRISGS